MSAYSIHLLRHLRFTIGRNIHALRTKRRMKLQKLSELTGISEAMLDAYELGKYEIGLREILLIACALEAEFAEVVGSRALLPGAGVAVQNHAGLRDSIFL